MTANNYLKVFDPDKDCYQQKHREIGQELLQKQSWYDDYAQGAPAGIWEYVPHTSQQTREGKGTIVSPMTRAGKGTIISPITQAGKPPIQSKLTQEGKNGIIERNKGN